MLKFLVICWWILVISCKLNHKENTMNWKRVLIVIVGYLCIAANFQTWLFPWSLLFGIVGGGIIGHAIFPYIKES